MTWILTHSGLRFDLANPRAAVVTPQDIAHALSNICRFNGHTFKHYSVAQHSVLLSSVVPPADALAGLLHDATEAYVGDVVRPLKQLLPEYQVIEARIWQAICERFDLPLVLPGSVKRADLHMLATERRDLMPLNGCTWPRLDGIAPMQIEITPWPPERAREAFLERLHELLLARDAQRGHVQ